MKVGNLILEKQLGEGWFGKVFLTTIEGDNDLYATKIYDREEIEKVAKEAFKALGSSGNARIDFLIDDSKNKVYINEINSIPGSLAFYLWEAKDVDFTKVLDEMIQVGIKDYKKRTSKTHSFNSNILQGFAANGGVKGMKGAKGKLR